MPIASWCRTYKGYRRYMCNEQNKRSLFHNSYNVPLAIPGLKTISLADSTAVCYQLLLIIGTERKLLVFSTMKYEMIAAVILSPNILMSLVDWWSGIWVQFGEKSEAENIFSRLSLLCTIKSKFERSQNVALAGCFSTLLSLTRFTPAELQESYISSLDLQI